MKRSKTACLTLMLMTTSLFWLGIHPANSPSAARETPGPDAGQPDFQQLLERMGVRYLPDERRLEVDGWVNMQKGLIEVFACAPDGKTHESVVVLDCVPSAVHAGLLALGLEPSGTDDADTTSQPQKGGAIVRVRWEDDTGTTHMARAEDWIWDERQKSTMPHVVWAFTGSFMQPTPGQPNEATYAANYVKSIVTTYHDMSAVIDNPLPEKEDDTIYYVNETAVPPVKTPITVWFEPVE